MGSPLYLRYWDTMHTTNGFKDAYMSIKLHRIQSKLPIQKSEGYLDIELTKTDKNPFHTLFFSIRTPEYTNSSYALKFNNIDISGDFSIEYTEKGRSLSDKEKIFFDDMIRFIYEKAGIKIPEPKTEKKEKNETAIDITAEDFKRAIESYNFNLYNDFVNDIIDMKAKIIDFLIFEGFKSKGFINPFQIVYILYCNFDVIFEVVNYVNKRLPLYGITDLKLDGDKVGDKVKAKMDKSKDPREYIKIIEKRWRLIYGED
jgi:hypothetical protein